MRAAMTSATPNSHRTGRSRAEIQYYYDDRCRGAPEGTITRLIELLCNNDMNAAMALILSDQEGGPSLVPEHTDQRHHA